MFDIARPCHKNLDGTQHFIYKLSFNFFCVKEAHKCTNCGSRLKAIFCQFSINYTMCNVKIQKVFSIFCSHIDVHLSVCLSIHHQSAPVCLHLPTCLSASLSLHSLTGLCVVRLSGHYMRHLFARCYCLHGGDFIRCCDNFINLGGNQSLFPREGENGEAKRGIGI